MGKSALKHKKAQEAKQLEVLEHALKKNRSLDKNPFKIFQLLLNKEVKLSNLPSDTTIVSVIKYGVARCHNKHEIGNFYKIARAVAKTKAKKLLLDYEVVKVFVQIAKHYQRRLRCITDWKPKTHNRNRQVSSLLRFVFANYEVPVFMDQAFFDEHIIYINWFIHIGRGNNIRTAKHSPIPVSKKMAHFFLQAPSHYSIIEALRFGQIRALGGSPRLVRNLIATHLGESFIDDTFWESVIRFFIQQTMLDPVHILPIVDYIQYVKFGAGRMINPQTGEIIQNIEAEKPNFSMKGRSIDTLLRDVNKWHNGLQKLQTNASWEPNSIADFSYTEGKENKQRTYKIQQLLNDEELKIEGRYMRHCVASYVHSCVRGHCSIWSMTIKNELTTEVNRLVTIEVRRNKTVVQVRGKWNAYPAPKTMDIIQKWIVKEGLRRSKWL